MSRDQGQRSIRIERSDYKEMAKKLGLVSMVRVPLQVNNEEVIG